MSGNILQPKIKEILIQNKDPKARKVFCETFSYHPENIEEMALGSLCVVGYLEDSYQTNSHIISLIISTLRREYYHKPKRNSAQSFKESLKKANAVLADLAKTGKIDWLNKLSLACVAIGGNRLYLTQVGKAKILLLRDGRLTDLGRKLVPSQEKIHPRKVFQSIASGKLFINDKIILLASDILKHISLKGFKQLLELNQIDQLKEILKNEKSFSTQGLIVLSVVKQEELIKEQKESLTLITPPLAIPSSVPKYNKFIGLKEKIINLITELNLRGNNFFFKMKDLLFFLKERFSSLREKFSKKKIKRILFSSFEKEKKETEETNIHSLFPEQKITISPEIKYLFRDIERPSSGFSFTPSPAEKSLKETDNKETIAKESIISQEKKDSISSPVNKNFFFSLWSNFQTISAKIKKIFSAPKIYHLVDKKPASKLSFKWPFWVLLILLVTAIFLINYFFDQKSKKEIASYENIIKEEEEKLEKINKIIKLETPETITDFTSSQQNFSPEYLLITKGNLIALDSTTSSINLTSLGQESKSNKFIETSLPAKNRWLKASIFKEDSIIFLGQNNEFYRYDFTNNKYSPLSLVLPFDKITSKDFVIYNDALYLLDASNNQIIKCPNLTNGTSWLKDTDNLSDAVALAIDGSIYILKSDGSFTNYFAGHRKATSFPKIRPTDYKINKIITAKNFQNIYLLDTKTKRIIVVNKNGELIKQITSPAFKNLRDMIVSDDEKKIFIADEDKIYKISN